VTLQSSGQMTFTDIQTEFGGTNPISLDEYYGAASGIPSSGQISMNQFYGKSSAWTRTLTVGHAGSGIGLPSNATGFVGHFYDPNNATQYTVDGGRGSLSPNNLFDNGATILNLMFNTRTPAKGNMAWEFNFRLVGTHANSGWNNMVMEDGKGTGGTVTVARTACYYRVYNSTVGTGLYNLPSPTTEWRYTYNSGPTWDDGSAATRASYYRTGISVLYAGNTGVPSPSLTWTLNKQISVTIN